MMSIRGVFLTGSRCYGIPRADSDIDIVVRCDREDVKLFAELGPDDPARDYPVDEKSHPSRVGNLNLILCFTDERFESWRVVTEKLKLIKPVSRDVAKAHFIERFKSEV